MYKCIEEWCIELVLQLHLSCNICACAHVFIWISVKMILMEAFHGANCIVVASLGDSAAGCPCLLYIVLACLKMRGSPTSKEHVPKNDEWDFGASKLDGDNPSRFFPMPLLLHLRTTWLGFPLRDL